MLEGNLLENIMAKPRGEEKAPESKTLIQNPIRDTNQVYEFDDKNLPPSLFEMRFHRPYASEFFGMNKELFLKLDNEGMNKLRNIDNFVNEQLRLQGLEDTRQSYEYVLNSILGALGIKENEKLPAKLDKINLVLILKKLFK